MAERGLMSKSLVAILTAAAIGISVLAVFVVAQTDKGGKPAAGKEGGAEGPPPALVAVSGVERGMVEPMAEFVGTVYYAHVSDVASEVAGVVEEAAYEEGRRVRAGQVLVRLSTELLDTAIEGTRASFEQAEAELEKAEKDMRRMEPLYNEGSISESAYEEHIYRVKSQRKKLDSLRATLEGQELEKDRKTIEAPFGGVVLKKSVEKGEWVPPGGTVAVIADNREVDVVVDVPSDVLGYLRRGREVGIKSGGRKLAGRFMSFIPRGDVATRTFSVKIRLRNSTGLVEGMEARAVLPSGPKFEGLLVHRDAVIEKFGMNVVFAVNDATAKMIPVRVTGYEGLMVGVEGQGLSEGMKVVVKGNERINDGQQLSFIGGGEK
jgi:RND family efflux transporter MFP subunit